LAPTVAGLQLNLAPRPDDEMPARGLACMTLQVPEQTAESAQSGGQIVGLATDAFQNQVFTLPARPAGQRPHTVSLRPARGILHVLEGRVRCEGELGEVELCEGDTAVFRGQQAEALVAAASPGRGVAARFRWVLICLPVRRATAQQDALQDAGPAVTDSGAAIVAATA